MFKILLFIIENMRKGCWLLSPGCKYSTCYIWEPNMVNWFCSIEASLTFTLHRYYLTYACSVLCVQHPVCSEKHWRNSLFLFHFFFLSDKSHNLFCFCLSVTIYSIYIHSSKDDATHLCIHLKDLVTTACTMICSFLFVLVFFFFLNKRKEKNH